MHYGCANPQKKPPMRCTKRKILTNLIFLSNYHNNSSKNSARKDVRFLSTFCLDCVLSPNLCKKGLEKKHEDCPNTF